MNKHYRELGGLWFYKGRILLDSNLEVCKQIMHGHHDTPFGGHSGCR